MKVTVLGAGIMGRGVALTLARVGFDVTLWNRTPEKAQAVAKEFAQETAQESSDSQIERSNTAVGTLQAEESFTDAIESADIIMTVLYDEASVIWALEESVTLQKSGKFKQNAVWIQAATIGVQGARRVSEFCKAHEIAAVEANMMGSKLQAETGQLVYIVGGASELVDKVRPVLEAGSKKIVHCGENIGDGSAVKIACNSWISFLTSGAAQSVAMLQNLGVDPNLWLEVIMDATSASPYAALKAPKMMAKDFSTQFAVDAILKDLGFAKELATMSNVDTDLLDIISDKFQKSSAKGFGTQDISAVVEAL